MLYAQVTIRKLMDSSKESRSNRNSTGSSHGGAGDEEPTLPPARSSSRSLSERTYSLSLSEGGRSASASVLSGMGTPLGEDYDDEDFDADADSAIEREIGACDGFVPVAAAPRHINPARADRGFHCGIPCSDHQAMGSVFCKAADFVQSPDCTEKQKPMHRLQRRQGRSAVTVLVIKAQQMPRDREFHRFGRTICPGDAPLRGPNRRAQSGT